MHLCSILAKMLVYEQYEFVQINNFLCDNTKIIHSNFNVKFMQLYK